MLFPKTYMVLVNLSLIPNIHNALLEINVPNNIYVTKLILRLKSANFVNDVKQVQICSLEQI